MAEHHFDIEIAKEYGIVEAILINNFQHWIRTNKANGINYHDGHTWTFNSMKAYEELFPYLSLKSIRAALSRLKEKGVLITGNYNETAYDRTLWYAFAQEGRWICPKGQMDFPETANGFAQEGTPIPYNKPNNNIIIVEDAHTHTREKSDFDYVLEWICDNEDGLQQMLYRNKLIVGLTPKKEMIDIILPYVQEYYEQQLMNGGDDITRRGRRDIKQHFSQWLPKHLKKLQQEQQQKQQEYEQGVDPITRAMQDFEAGWNYAASRKEQEQSFECI